MTPTKPPVRPTPTGALAGHKPVPGEKQEALVLHVVDGDTIVVELDGQRRTVRYIGIDTPETHHPEEGADFWGFEATEANRSWVPEGATVILQRDITETDRYGRLLRYVFVGDTLVNAELVRMGLARVLFYEPDVLYRSQVMAAEAEARAAERGLYGPPPTPPAESALLYKGRAWTQSPAGRSVPLWFEPARGDSTTAFPAGLQVDVVDAFWVPESQAWWYWIGVQGFNGWTTGEYLSRQAPQATVEGPVVWLEAYDEVVMSCEALVYPEPGRSGKPLGTLDAGAVVELKRLSRSNGAWWYAVESTALDGWIEPDCLGR
jgi:endonuclease YncB( thermonuclease family)